MRAIPLTKLVLGVVLSVGLLALGGCVTPAPTAMPPPTSTPAPPTATPLPPTETLMPPTNTPIPPTSTLPPPTATPKPPTATPVPPTSTPVPPTDTPLPPTATATQPAAPSPTVKPAAQPVGRGKILMTSNRESWDDIFVMNEDGSGVTRLTTMGRAYGARFSPDGTRIAFYHYDDQNLSDIYVMNADGTGLTNITNTPDKWEDSPDWSPDGRQVAYLFVWAAAG